MLETLSVQERLEEEPSLLYPLEAEAFLELMEMGRTDGISAWRSPAVDRREGSTIEGQGLFALEDIPANTVVAIKPGRVIDGQTVQNKADIIQGSQQQVGPDRFLAGLTPEEVDKNLVGYNHSCDPNAKIVLFKGASLAFVVTRQAVEAGDELAVDYSVSQMTNTHFMVCDCGAPNCRGIVAPLWDWEEPDFQARYGAEFSWFIRDAIDEQREFTGESMEAERKFHTLLRLAGGLRLLDQALNVLEAVQERQSARVLEEWRPAITEDWQQTPEAARQKRYEELRLETAARFCAFYPLLGQEDLGIDRSGFLPDTAIDHDEAIKTLHDQLGPHLNEITGLAEDLAKEFDHDFKH